MLPKYTCQSLAKVYTSYIKGKYYTHATICPVNLATPLSGITDEQASLLSTNALVGVRRNTAFYYYRFKCATCLNCNGFFYDNNNYDNVTYICTGKNVELLPFEHLEYLTLKNKDGRYARLIGSNEHASMQHVGMHHWKWSYASMEVTISTNVVYGQKT